MHMRRRAWIVIFAALGLLLIIWGFIAPKEPVSQGKTVSQWLAEGAGLMLSPLAIRGDPCALSNFLAATPPYCAIKALGTNAIPRLMRIVDSDTSFRSYNNSKFRMFWHNFYWQYVPNVAKRVIPPPGSPFDATYIKQFAVCTLIFSGWLSFEEKASQFVKLHEDRDSHMHEYALMMLKSNDLTNEQVELFIRKLCWDDRNFDKAWRIQDRLHFQCTNLVKYFTPMLQAKEEVVRRRMLFTLKEMGPFAKPALSGVMNIATNDPEMLDRRVAIEVIGAMGPQAKEAAPLLLDLISNAKGDDIRAAAQKALRNVEPDNAALPAPLRQAVQ